MKTRVCPICHKTTGFYPIKNYKLCFCKTCNLIFQIPSKKVSFTPNEPTWGENDPRTTESTYKMKQQTFQLLVNEIRKFKNDGILLDIGAGIGALVKVAQQNGYKAVGLEPEKKFVQIAKKGGLNILNETIETSTIASKSIDIITMFDVIEHMQNCNEAVKKVHSLLKKEGLFVISTPNIDSLSFKLMGKNWAHYKKEHIYYFSPKSLKTLLENHGFRIVNVSNSLKALNLDYISGYFIAFKHPIFTPLSKMLITILPKFLTHVSLNVSNGNMLVIAKK